MKKLFNLFKRTSKPAEAPAADTIPAAYTMLYNTTSDQIEALQAFNSGYTVMINENNNCFTAYDTRSIINHFGSFTIINQIAM
jgi:hypothetical protein